MKTGETGEGQGKAVSLQCCSYSLSVTAAHAYEPSHCSKNRSFTITRRIIILFI